MRNGNAMFRVKRKECTGRVLSSGVGRVEASTANTPASTPNTPASTPKIICCGCLLYSTGKQTLIHRYAAFTFSVVNIGNSTQDPSLLPYIPFL